MQAGEGGADARKFKDELVETYKRWAQHKNLSVAVLEQTDSKVSLSIKGNGV